MKEMQADPLLSKIPAVAKGNIAFLENGPIGAAANPSPLSISWGIERYFDALDDGLEKLTRAFRPRYSFSDRNVGA